MLPVHTRNYTFDAITKHDAEEAKQTKNAEKIEKGHQTHVFKKSRVLYF